jgi:hypothetical protein
MRALSRAAVHRASAAFNECQLELVDELETFAMGVYPEMRRSLPWMRLILKRQLGYQLWNAMSPALKKARKLFHR